MKNNAQLLMTLSIAVALSAGCATAPMNSQDIQKDADAPKLTGIDVSHAVAPGDRLSDIALRYTGQVEQWEAIAAYNNITDPRTLRIGDTLTIPASMIPDRNRQPAKPLSASTSQEAPISDRSGVVATTTGTLALQRAREVQETQSEDGNVRVAPVNTNRTFELSPIENSSLATANLANAPVPKIRVIGSYYPKGVYQQPAGYSKLLMRVAPGTVFELDQKVNDWYKVVTNQGIGYIRTVDAKLNSD